MGVIGLDACYLTGEFGGVLMAATALDAQNGLVMLGIIICRVETKENWIAFLKHLKDAILAHPLKVAFISDRQKGLLEDVTIVFCGHHHKYGWSHLYKNFKKYYKGLELHGFLWNAAKAYKEMHFQEHFDNIMKENVAAGAYLRRENPATWRTESASWVVGNLVPSVVTLIKKMFLFVTDYGVDPCVDEELYMVTSPKNYVFTVNILAKTFSCLQWQLRGFSCMDTVSAFHTIRPQWIKYCSDYYSVENYKATYAPTFEPLDDKSEWVKYPFAAPSSTPSSTTPMSLPSITPSSTPASTGPNLSQNFLALDLYLRI
ncbi:uncharacterized protein LOC113340143 [Papaver somniferum]|uniref:uncharacterized protein LOC113340143 n=1 Tax=Papaver somniferum TaxID=3469 RepID=UPI000E6FBF34|nr:uncharacterized protein LOC113340143 [Papaver somniferum]